MFDTEEAKGNRTLALFHAIWPEGAENASLQVTGLAAGTATDRVIGPFATVPAPDLSSRTAVGEWRQA